MEELFGTLLDGISADLTTFITNGVGALQGAMTIPLSMFAVIYIGLTAYLILAGQIEMAVGDLVKRMFRILIAILLVTNSAFFADYLISTFWGTTGGSVGIPDRIGQILLESTVSSSGTGSGATQLSEISATYSDRVSLVAAGIKANGGWFSGLTAMFVALFLYIVLLVGFFIIIISKMGMAITLVIGPFILAGMLFGIFRGLVDGWFKQLLNFALTGILGYAVMSVMLSVTSSYALTTINGGTLSSGVTGSFALIVLSLVSALVLMQVPSVATGIAGGVPVTDMGSIGRAGRAAGRGTKNYASGKAAQGTELAKSGYSKAAPYVSQKVSNMKSGASDFASKNIAPRLSPQALKVAHGAIAGTRAASQGALKAGRTGVAASRLAYKAVAPRTSVRKLEERDIRKRLGGKS